MAPMLVAETYHSTISRDDSNIKLIIKRSLRSADPHVASRWRDEVNALTRVGSHPNIVQLISASEVDLSITLSLAPGRALSSYEPATLFPYAYEICLQTSRALLHIHDMGLVHDDIKPDNIMFSIPSPIPSTSKQVLPIGSTPLAAIVTIVDFGACINSNNFTTSGTPWYMAPEYIQQRPKGPETDVWALGVTMAWILKCFELLPGTNHEDWILPHIWDDKKEMQKMIEWIVEVEEARLQLKKGKLLVERVVAEMIEADPRRRIRCAEVVRRLGSD